MPETERDWAALALDAGAGVADGIATGLAGTPAGAALSAGSAIAKLVSRLVRTVGVEETGKLVEDLVARKLEGAISNDDLRADDAGVMNDIASWYADDDDEHPSDDPANPEPV